MTAVNRWRRFAVLFVLALLVAPAGCGKKDEPTKDTPKADNAPKPTGRGAETVLAPVPEPAPTPPADLKTAKPDATYTMNAFIAEMTKDRNFPVSKHAGKVIELTGVVRGYGAGPNAGAFMLETDPARPQDARPEKVSGGRPWTKALPTQTVTLRAQVASSTTALDPYPWQFVEAKGAPPAAQTAEQLVKERDTDPKAFGKKYDDAWVLVTGTVAEAKPGTGGPTEFLLAAGEQGQLLCTIPATGFAVAPLTPTQQAALKPGTKVKVLGQPTGDRLTLCIVLEPAP